MQYHGSQLRNTGHIFIPGTYEPMICIILLFNMCLYIVTCSILVTIVLYVYVCLLLLAADGASCMSVIVIHQMELSTSFIVNLNIIYFKMDYTRLL